MQGCGQSAGTVPGFSPRRRGGAGARGRAAAWDFGEVNVRRHHQGTMVCAGNPDPIVETPRWGVSAGASACGAVDEPNRRNEVGPEKVRCVLLLWFGRPFK